MLLFFLKNNLLWR